MVLPCTTTLTSSLWMFAGGTTDDTTDALVGFRKRELSECVMMPFGCVLESFLFFSFIPSHNLPFYPSFFFFKLHCHWLLLQLPETCLIIYILYFIINKTDNDSFYFTGFIDYKQNKNKIIKQQWFLTVF